jgi:hypothetical protein
MSFNEKPDEETKTTAFNEQTAPVEEPSEMSDDEITYELERVMILGGDHFKILPD